MKKLVQISVFLTLSAVGLFLFQNLGWPNGFHPPGPRLPWNVPVEVANASENTSPANNQAVGKDIREMAPRAVQPLRNPWLAPEPSSGGDMQSVGTRWLEREGQPLLKPFEEQFVAKLNRRIDRFFHFEQVQAEDWPDENYDKKKDKKKDDDKKEDNGGIPGLADLFSMAPTSMRFKRINEVIVGFGQRAQLTCEVIPSATTVRFETQVSPVTSFGIKHDVGRSQQTMNLSYSW